MIIKRKYKNYDSEDYEEVICYFDESTKEYVYKINTQIFRFTTFLLANRFEQSNNIIYDEFDN